MCMDRKKNVIQEYLLSYIIIIYNTNLDLLRRCLNSINKNAHETEVIVVDDGSTMEGIKELCEQYKNMTYIYKTNGGAGSARNEGLLKASGKYIFFIDSDDYILSNPISLIDLKNINLDIIFLDYFIETNEYKKKHFIDKKFFYENSSFNQFLFRGLLGDYNIFNGYTIGAIWNKLFKREFLLKNKIFFDINIPKGQDVIFVLQCLIKEPKIYYLDAASYVYYINNESICHKPNENLIKYYNIFLKSLNNLIPIVKKNKKLDSKIIEICYEKAVLNCLYSVLSINVFNTNLNISLKERKVNFNKVYNAFDKFIKLNSIKINSSNTFKERIKLLCIKHKLFYFLYFYQLMMKI